MTEHELYKSLIQENLADRERIRLNARRAGSKPHTLRRWLAAAACLIAVLAVTTLCIPTARAAVVAFFTKGFDANDYLGQDPDSRAQSPVPAIDALKVGDAVWPGQITLVNEAYHDRLADFDIRIEEVFSDGQMIWLTGSFGGRGACYVTAMWGGAMDTRVLLSKEHWMEHMDDYWDPDDYDPGSLEYWQYPEAFLSVQLNGESADCNFSPVYADIEKGFGITEGTDWDDPDHFEKQGRSMDAYLAAGGRIRFTASIGERNVYEGTDFSGLADENGCVSIAPVFRVGYCDCGYNDTPGTLLTASFETLHVDVSGRAAQENTRTFENAAVTLEGEAVLTTMHNDWDTGEIWITNETIALDGVKITLKELQLFPMSANMIVEYDLPDTWSAERAKSFFSGYGCLGFELFVNGTSLKRSSMDFSPGTNGKYETVDEAAHIYRRSFFELGIDPRDYAAIESLKLVPVLVYYTDCPEQPENGWSGDEHVQRFDGMAIQTTVF